MNRFKYLFVSLLLGISSFGQAPNAPVPKKVVVAEQAFLWSAAATSIKATSYGSHACYLENLRDGTPERWANGGGGIRHANTVAAERVLPIAAGASLASWFLNKKGHRTLAAVVAGTVGGAFAGSAAVQFSAGCF